MRFPVARLGLLLIALVASGCSSAASSPPTATRPAESGPTESDSGPTVTPGTPAEPARRTLLVDTDVAADDLVALAFLVASPHVELAAITVSGTGEAHCPAGVNVVLRLLDALDAPEIPVACGRETPLAGTH
ncbi:MAG TPA: nucleoside hydrolase, partial [Candidatus Limnocylindria bacterium]|nr:nucleoside hydrolase [Candidatus Limnocylindria bacterium]